MRSKEIGIFSGSFNPIHLGHLMLANYMCEFTPLEEVWFVVSPQNPLKEAHGLLDDDLRLEMTRRALEDFPSLLASDVEFGMPRPSYTIDTLTRLREMHPDKRFTLIIGGDNWVQFDRWKTPQQLIRSFQIFIYPRLGEEIVIPESLRESVRPVDAPVIELSSTFIRNSIREGKNMRAFLPPAVYDFIEAQKLYR